MKGMPRIQFAAPSYSYSPLRALLQLCLSLSQGSENGHPYRIETSVECDVGDHWNIEPTPVEY